MTLDEIAGTYLRSGLLIDPHTAVAVAAARREIAAAPGAAPIIALATAHPAKFPDAVERATGQRPGLPQRLSGLFEREERYAVLPGDLGAVQAFIADRALASA